MPFKKIKSKGFSSISRLLRKDGFKQVLSAEKVADKQLKIFFLINKTAKTSRLGIIASKKLFSKAVDRNQIKREIREMFRQHTIKTSQIDLVVLVKKTHSNDYKVNRHNLDTLFSQIEKNAQTLN